jgi:hypothetical protein
MTPSEPPNPNPPTEPNSATPSERGTPVRVKRSQRSKKAAGSAPIAVTVPRKLRADSTFNKLTLEQRQQLEKWLTVDNLRYADAAQKFEQEFGFKVSTSALGGLFQYYQEQRLQAQQEIKLELVFQTPPSLPMQVKVLRNGKEESTVCIEPAPRDLPSATKDQPTQP